MSGAPIRSPDVKSGVAHLRSLTGWRFVAAVFVFFAHINLVLTPAARPLAAGGPAVSFFFVLSGFIMMWVYADRLVDGSRLNRQAVRKYWFTRLARVWPLQLACLAIFLVLIRGVSGTFWQANGPANLVAVATMTQSWIPLPGWYTGFNSVSWSISTEIFFYLVFPVFLWGPARWFRWKFLAVVVIGFTTAGVTQWQIASGHWPGWLQQFVAIVFPLTRLIEFVLGIATCRLLLARVGRDAVNHPPRSFAADTLREWMVLVLLCLVWYLMWQFQVAVWIRSTAGGSVFAAWFRVAGSAPFFALLIWVFATSRGMTSRVLGSPLLLWLGDISYSFYLIHQIVIRSLEDMRIPDWQFIAVSFWLALFASGLLFRIVEMPAKHAALAWYQGERRKAAGLLGSGLNSALTTRMGLVQTACLVAGLLVLLVLQDPRAEQREIEGIIASTPDSLRDIRFGDDAVLKGVRLQNASGGLQLDLVWRPLSGNHRQRIIHLCDADGQLIGHGPGGRVAWQDRRPGVDFIETIVIRRRDYRGVRSLALGFWSEQLGFAPLAAGSGAVADWIDPLNRLHLIRIGKNAEAALATDVPGR